MASTIPDFFPLLKQVSRSFYLTLRVLPRPVRKQIGLAYLLARATDTIADTELVPVEQRLNSLEELRNRITGARSLPIDFSNLLPSAGPREGAAGGERELLERIEEIISALNAFSPADQEHIRAVINTITGGQELDLRRFSTATAMSPIALQSEADLDDYTYRVAGCVGEFWTHICCAHIFRNPAVGLETLIERGIRFGKGLQLVNVLRDLPRDLRQGRCYIPEELLSKCGLEPIDLLNPHTESAFRPLYNRLLDRAEEHLRAGWAYTNSLPRGAVRIRLACAWPILIGVQTVSHLRNAAILDAKNRVKVSRKAIRNIMMATALRYPFPRAWNVLFDIARQQPRLR